MANVITTKRTGSKLGRERSEHDRILRSEGWGGTHLNTEQRDKLKYLEKKHGKGMYNRRQIDGVR